MKKLALAAAIAIVTICSAHAQVPGWIPSMSQGIIAYLHGANMNVTTDQKLVSANASTNWQVTSIEVTNCASSPSGVVGGFYTAASKGGTALVAATQTYTSLTTAAAIEAMTLGSGIATTRLTTGGGASIYFSLTTALGSSDTCDIYAIGIGLP